MHDELDPGTRSFLDALARLDAQPLALASLDVARRQQVEAVALGQGAHRDEVFRVADTHAASIPVRTYQVTDSEPDLVVMFLHGGGWVLGDLETADGTARSLASRLNCTVVSVDYRLAPEHPYPAAEQDCVAVLAALCSRYPTSRIGVAGDSSGGNLALAVSAASVGADDLRVDAQLLVYPALDPTQASSSHDRYSDGYVLTKDAMGWFWRQYLDGAAQDYVTPRLTGLPPTVITTAGFDPLQDEGRQLAEHLDAEGVPTTFLHHPALTHAWLDSAGTVAAARRARDEVIDAFAIALASTSSREVAANGSDLVLDRLAGHSRGGEGIE